MVMDLHSPSPPEFQYTFFIGFSVKATVTLQARIGFENRTSWAVLISLANHMFGLTFPIGFSVITRGRGQFSAHGPTAEACFW